jgi:hypothetical protein
MLYSNLKLGGEGVDGGAASLTFTAKQVLVPFERLRLSSADILLFHCLSSGESVLVEWRWCWG